MAKGRKCVLVCGGRDYTDAARLFGEMTRIERERGRFTLVIHGGARGADTLGGEWAAQAGIEVQAFMADWNGQGRAAGPIRNQRMLEEGKPDLVVAFPGGRGTADMVRRAMAAGIEVINVGGAGVSTASAKD